MADGKKLVLGIDVGGTKILAGVVDETITDSGISATEADSGKTIIYTLD